jgi:RNA polymerase sigma-70 factor, ECF subfamily
MVEDGCSRIDETLARDQMSQCIRGYITRLPASYRSVGILSELEGLANQEIAGALRISLDTVKIRLHRARALLSTELPALTSPV